MFNGDLYKSSYLVCLSWFCLYNLRHDAGEVEHLSRQVGHVAVHKDEQGLDDPGVGGEARGEGCQDPVDGSDQDAAQSHHEEGNDSQEGVHHRHCVGACKLLEKVVQHLRRGGRRRRVSDDVKDNWIQWLFY